MSASGFFIGLPWGFTDLWDAKEVDDLDYLLASYLAKRCFAARNTSAGIAVIELAEPARRWGVSVETIRRRFQRFRDRGWIDFRTARGSDPTWRIWLTGLSIEEPTEDLAPQTQGSDLWSHGSTSEAEPTGANPQPESDSPPPPLHKRLSGASDKRYEPRPQSESKAKALDEEKLEEAVGENSGGETDQLLAALKRAER